MSKRVKQYLMLLAALGVVAVALGGGSGTFASFNAQVSNQNNVFATGTLFLHQQPFGGNLCRSEDNGATNLNVNVNCDVLFGSSNAFNLKPGQQVTAKIDLSNAGTINASTFTLNTSCTAATPVIGTVHTYASNATSIVVDGLTQSLLTGTQLAITDVNGNPIDSPVTVGTSVTSPAATNQSVTVSGIATGSASTAYLHVYATFGGTGLCDLSNGVQFYVQETDSNWNPNGSCLIPSGASDCSFSSAETLKKAANDGANSLGTLSAGGDRYFIVGLKVPDSGVDNTTQNSAAKFDLDWKIAQ